MASGCVHNVGLLRGEMRLDGVAKKLRITITTKALSKRARFRTKQIKGFFDVRLGQRLEHEDPVEARGLFNEYKDLVRPPITMVSLKPMST